MKPEFTVEYMQYLLQDDDWLEALIDFQRALECQRAEYRQAEAWYRLREQRKAILDDFE